MPELPASETPKPCLLVIDDDEAVGWAIARRLGPDFRVVSLADPTVAVEVALHEKPRIILCDIDMPRMQGDEVAFALSQDLRTTRIPLVYLTALVSPEDAPELEGVFGDHPAISKGASTADLRKLIDRLLRKAA